MRPNRRPGRCLDCGEPVEPGTGMIRRVGAREWGAVHLDGQHSAPPAAPVVVQERREPGRTNRFTTQCAGCQETVPPGKGKVRENITLCADCDYGRS